LSEYSYVNILSQIAQIAQRECSRLHHFAEKDSLVRLMLFCGLSA
jgi:hypothetical protein